jgi:hypothetical protein
MCYLSDGSGPQFIAAFYKVHKSPHIPHNKHSTYHAVAVPVSTQITATRHAIKTDCGVGVAAGGNTCSDILVMVGCPVRKTVNNVS